MQVWELEHIVVWEMYCNLDLFWENVGNDRTKVLMETKKAKNPEDLIKIINRYI